MCRIILVIMVMMLAGCGEPEPGNKSETGAPPEQASMSGSFGRGTQNEDEKLASMKQDAEAGSAKAQVGLARKYYNGDDVPQDFAKAAEWYEKAAEQGIAMAQYNIGMMYQKGEGVTQDAAKAEAWLNKAAEQGLK